MGPAKAAREAKQPGATRRTQQRAIETRLALLDTAIDIFSRRGYEGVSVRQIEELAGVKRGLVAYHFNDKETLWKSAVSRLFDKARDSLLSNADLLADMEPMEAARTMARLFIRYSAEHPALNRLMMQESMSPTWRVDYLVDEQIRPFSVALGEHLPEVAQKVWGNADPHRYYLFVGAGAFVFSAEEECKALFGVSPRDPSFIERHADLVLNVLLGER